MQVSVEAGEGLQRRMTVEVPAERVNQAVESRLKSLARSVRIDGFRPGKVPVKIVRQRFGEQARHEAFGEIIQSTFYEAASQEKLQPAGEPKIELKDDDDGFGYTAEFEVMPEIGVADMAEVTVEREAAEVTDGDVDAMLEKLRTQRTTWSTVERPAQDGDQLVVSFAGKVDGEPFEGGSAEDVSLVLGSGMMIEGFEKALLGAAAGETRTIDLKFPDDYRVEKLAGRPVTFEVTVKQVQQPVMPALDADFARVLGVESGDLDALRQEVRGNMTRELKQKLRTRLKDRVMALLLEQHDIDVPAVMVDSEAERLKEQTRQQMGRSGQASGVNLPLDVFKEEARRRVKLGLVIGEVVRSEGLRVDEDRMRRLAEEFASAYEEPEAVVNFYLTDTNARGGLENLALEDQVVDWVLDKAKIEDKQTTFDAVM